MLFGVWWHRPVGGSIRHEATLNYNGDVPAAGGLSTIGTWLLQCSLPDADPSAAVARRTAEWAFLYDCLLR